MKTNIIILLTMLLSNLVNSQSQLMVFQEWARNSGTQHFFERNVTKTDGSGNVYVAGATTNSSANYDVLVAKYNSSGVQQWIIQHDGGGSGHDMAIGLTTDASGNVYITGVTTTSTNIDMFTAKYNSSGTQQWLSTYNGPGNTYDCGTDVVADVLGNVYVCGSSYNASGNTDYVTIKYNSSGAQQWATRYDHTSGMNDGPVRLALNVPTSSVKVSGAVQTSSTAYGFGVISYDRTSGAQIGATVTGGGSSGIDQVFDMTSDASNNIYIAGGIPITGQGYNTCVIKLNSSLAIQWQATYNGIDSLDDMANGIQVDNSGNDILLAIQRTAPKEKTA
jgi:hypothetical protein